MISRIATTATSLSRSDRLGFMLLAMWIAAAPSVAGCGRREVLGPVTGRVTLAGEPVQQGYVIFRNEAKGVHMMAEIDETGEYRVSMAGGYGLPLGDYLVYLSPPVADVPFGPAKEPPRPSEVAKFPNKYLQPETSGLQLTVKDGDNRMDINMQP